nr:amidohydrolase family protein [Candidatus Bathyarchaeota archaeon]
MAKSIPDELYADLVLINGKIATIDKDDSIVEAIACKGERIIKVGTTEEVEAYIGKHTNVIDLEGKLVTPGFVDTHVHFSSGGRRVRTVDLRYVRSMDALIEELKKKADTLRKGRWLQGYGYNESKLKEKRFPNRYDLDKASMDHPISVTRQGGHDGIRVNSLALELAGISKDTPDPEPPSFIMRDPETGEPLGNLREEGAKPVLDLIAQEPVLTKEEMKEGLVKTDTLMLSWGITSIQEPGAPMDFLPMYRELLDEGRLHIRNTFLIAAPTLGRSYHRNERYQVATDISIEAGYSTNFGDNHLKFAGIKLGHDGSM